MNRVYEELWGIGLSVTGYDLVDAIDSNAAEIASETQMEDETAIDIANSIAGYFVSYGQLLEYWESNPDPTGFCTGLDICTASSGIDDLQCEFLTSYFTTYPAILRGRIIKIPEECTETTDARSNALNNPGDITNCETIEDVYVMYCDTDLSSCTPQSVTYGVAYSCAKCSGSTGQNALETQYGNFSTTTLAYGCTTCNYCANSCTDDASWTTYSTSQQYRNYAICNCDSQTCEYEKHFRCAPGYYNMYNWGTSTEISNVYCQRCPAISGTYTNSTMTTLAYGTSAGGNIGATTCYMQDGTYYETAGTFAITGASSRCKYAY